MDHLGLNNPAEFPSDSVLARQLGPAQADPLVRASCLDKALKDDFLNNNKKLRAIRVEV